MKVESRKDIKAHLDRALAMQSSVICILKCGLTETEHIYSNHPVIHIKIEFQPQNYYEDYYSGLMYYPNGKSRGLMDCKVNSFDSVICLEEA